MDRLRWILVGVLVVALPLALCACDNEEEVEGDEPGECSDGADNDQNGMFDCIDQGCFGSPDCTGDDDDAQGDDDDVQTDDDDVQTDDDDDVQTDDDDDVQPDDDDATPGDDDDTGSAKDCEWLCQDIDSCGLFGQGHPWGNDMGQCVTWCGNNIGDPPPVNFLKCAEVGIKSCDAQSILDCI